jgi:hypothetical protein
MRQHRNLLGTSSRRSSLRRRIGGRASILAIAPVGAIALMGGGSGGWEPNAMLHAPHVGATNPGFGQGSCPTPDAGTDGDWGWHFVLPGNKTKFVEVEVTLKAPTGESVVVTDFQSHPSAKHAYVYTPSAGYTLEKAEALVSGPQTRFVLSHVCDGSRPAS